MTAKVEESLGLISVARGTGDADLYLEGGNLVNVLSGEIYPANVAVWNGKIAYVGLSRKMVGLNTRVIDAGGCYLCPGLIEAHFHPWFVYNPVSIMGVALASGITTMLCDSLIFYINLGAERFLKMLKALENYPLRLFWTARIAPQSPYPEETEFFSLENLKKVFFDPHVLKVGEITRWPALIQGDSNLVEKINLAKQAGLGIDGHTAGSTYELLNAVAAAGVRSCHESITAEEIANRVRLGLWAMLRYSSLRPDLPELINVITEMNLSTHRMMLSTDCSTPSFIAREGFLDKALQIAVSKGLNPVTALQMTTLNPATYLGLDDELGSIAPGRWADLLLVEDLENFSPRLVFSRGKLVAVDGKLINPLTEPDWGELGLYSRLPSPDLVSDP
ncbi:MAG: Adenine deaminase, partial [Desulfotomaculum sp. 46_296]